MSARSLRWLAYARWIAQDALWQRLTLPFLIAALVPGVSIYSLRHQNGGTASLWTTPDGIRFADSIFRQGIGTFTTLGVFLAIAGIVSQDRVKGHYRFLLSKPVPAPALYALVFVVHVALTTLLAAVLASGISALTAPQHVAGAIGYCALTVFMMGSVLFLLGAITNYDSAIGVFVWFLTSLAREVEVNMPVGHWLHTAVRALPPTHRLSALKEALLTGQPMLPTDLWHVLGWGSACLVLGLIVLRRLPLSR